MMNVCFRRACLALGMWTGVIGAAEIPAGDSRGGSLLPKGWELAFESGILWRAGHNGSYLNYIIMPQILTVKTPFVVRHAYADGSELTLRSRFSLLAEPIVKGPENHFIAATASGLLEWWSPRRSFSLFFASGGGLGGLDSKGYEVKDAQGQDLNFTWFLYPGMRFHSAGNWSGSAGIYFQHFSNRGLDKVNPGVDAVGPMLSLAWRF
jgi:lipid A 3-O-deacylase